MDADLLGNGLVRGVRVVYEVGLKVGGVFLVGWQVSAFKDVVRA